MQLEAFQLLRNQREQGFDETSAHENFSTKIGGYRTLRLWLTQDGTIYKIEPFLKEDEPVFWTFVKGTSAKTKRFPALRLTYPLLDLDKDSIEWELLEKIGHKNSDQALINKVLKCIGEYLNKLERNPQDFSDAWEEGAKPILDWKNQDNNKELTRLDNCVNAFGKFTGLLGLLGKGKKLADQQRQLAMQVSSCLIEAVKISISNFSDKDEVEALVQLVVGKRIKEKGKVKKIDSAQVCIDYFDPDTANTIYTAAMHPLVKLCLPTSSVIGTCSLSGEQEALLLTKFASWDTKLFKMPIYSKNIDAPCNTRYSRAGMNGFSVSERMARSITSGLEEMTSVAREQKTWAKIYNGKYKKKSKREEQDLLLAYPSFPIEKLRTIDVFKPRDRSELDNEIDKRQRFETLAQSLCSRLQAAANSPQKIPAYLQVLLVRKASEGQIQLVFSGSPTIEYFIAALNNWEASGRNLPPAFKVPLPSSNDQNGIGWFSPHLLFPEEISRLLTHQWIRNGMESSRIEAPSVGTIFELFLRKPGVWQDHAAHLLETTLSQTSILLASAGQIIHKYALNNPDNWPAKWNDFVPKDKTGKPDLKKTDPRYQFAKTISLIGSLLYAMNSTTDKYMIQSAFLVGKLLAMMDELHKCYCIAIRDGDIPNSLMGNGLLGRAGESPAQAISELVDRSRIYLGWAKTALVSDEAKNESPRQKQIRNAVLSAQAVLKFAELLSEQLHDADDLEVELTPVRKAHLLLGYLSPVLNKDI